jgi:D-alanyl-D-alanine carboxypeptidase
VRVNAKRFLWAVACVSVFALAAACDDDDDDSDGDPSPDDDSSDDESPDDDSPGDDDTSPQANDALQTLLEEYVYFSGETGIAAAWAHGQDPLTGQAAGLANIQTEQPLTPAHSYRVGSGTKPFTAAVVMQLVDEGLVDLDGLLTAYLPEYDQWPGLTVRHLLAMQSGIADYLLNAEFWLFALVHLGEPFTPPQLVQYAIEVGPDFEPGTACGYSNTNYVLLGMIVERVTGRTAAQELSDRIFTPLGLDDTFLDNAGDPLPTLSHGYADAALAGPVLGLDAILQLIIGLIPPRFIIDGYLVDGTYLLHPSFAWTAGGIVSTPNDLGAFMRAWIRGELASDAAMAEVLAFEPCEIMGTGVEYGLGIDRIETEFGYAYGHGGLHFGYATSIYDLPDADLTFAIVNNFIPDQLPMLFLELVRAIHDLPATAATPCPPPADFFTAPHANDLQVRFRGPLHLGGDPNVVFGLSGARMKLAGVWRAYNGYGAYAYNYWTPDGERLKLESYGPRRTNDWDLRAAVIDLNADIYQSVDAAGVARVGLLNLDSAVPLAMDLKLGDDAVTVVKVCISAVPDLNAVARYGLCQTAGPSPAVGDLLRVYADIPMKTDAASIDAFVEMLLTTRCQCLDDDGEWAPC